MPDRFPDQIARDLLVACHRRCCICHKYTGVRMEVHHIEPRSEGGESVAANAIALCFDCHAEVEHYNARHPRGRRFSSLELQGHRDQWLRICRELPQALLDAPRFGNPGPLEAILAELHLNLRIAGRTDVRLVGMPFEIDQLRRGLIDGTVLLLEERIQESLHEALLAMSRANTFISALSTASPPQEDARALTRAQEAIGDAKAPIELAIATLLPARTGG